MSEARYTLLRGTTKWLAAGGFTLGVLITGASRFATVEDPVRELTNCTQTTCAGKIPGVTAIPAGEYEILDTFSPRFGRNVLELRRIDGKSGFVGIRVHSGNSADDTEGCLILGLRGTETGVEQSRLAIAIFNAETRADLAKGRVFITIKDAVK
jgi:hypothetical protein